MLIPKSFRLGKRRYTVKELLHAPRFGTAGEVAYGAQEIIVAQANNVNGRAYKQEDISDTFWHEVTHAILHDMGEDHRNETFVTEFAKRLNQVVNTAKL